MNIMNTTKRGLCILYNLASGAVYGAGMAAAGAIFLGELPGDGRIKLYDLPESEQPEQYYAV